MQTSPTTPPADTSSPTVTMKPLSFSSQSTPTKDNKVYRGTELSSHHSMPAQLQSLSFVPSKIGSSKMAPSGDDFDDFKMPSMGKSELQPLDISYTLVVDNDTELSLSAQTVSTPKLFVPALKVPASSEFVDECCNDLNSCLVEADSFQTMTTLNDVLSAYSEDIDFELDRTNKRIDGVVFLSNYSVFFILYIHEIGPNQTRFEFRRSGGDSLAAAKFWAELQQQFAAKMAPNTMDIDCSTQSQFSFINLDLNLNGLELDQFADLVHDDFTDKEIDRFTLSMVENDCFLVDDLSFLYEAIMENGADKKCRSLLAHKPFMTQLVNRLMLNQDVCVLRFAVLILDRLSRADCTGILEVANSRFFENAALCMSHKRQFIKRAMIGLLDNLCSAPQWNLTSEARDVLLKVVKAHSNQQEVNQIALKLMMQ